MTTAGPTSYEVQAVSRTARGVLEPLGAVQSAWTSVWRGSSARSASLPLLELQDTVRVVFQHGIIRFEALLHC